MLNIIFAIFGVGCILLVGEVLWRLNIVRGEYARKFVHILTATFAAFWAFYMPPSAIAFVALCMIAVVIKVSRYSLFNSIRAIKRATYGEIWYPLGIGVTALIFVDPYVYAIAILHLGLADGMAAVVGVGLGKKAKIYKVGKSKKSVAGTATFIAISFAIYLLFWLKFDPSGVFASSPGIAVLLSASSAIVVSAVEAIAPKGSDNIAVPVVAGLFAVLPTMQLIV